ncbi:MAG: NAD(P)-dependent alcohol dehydrogenase [Caulobacteraceae bacterium]
MRAYEILPEGEGMDRLRMVERPEPSPGQGQVKLRVRAASLNYRDQLMVRGGYRTGQTGRPVIPLSDGAGEVVEVGPGVTRVKVGDRVAATFFQPWVDGRPPKGFASLGNPLDGMLTEAIVLDEDGVVTLPGYLSFEEAACLPCAALTAWHALFVAGRPLRAGQTVLVQGTGGVSIFALQFARAAGARVIATTSSDEKASRLKALGASEVVNYRSHPEWDKEVRRLTGEQGVDVVVEVGGAGTLPRSYQAVGWGGKICLIGVMTQPEDAAQLNPIGLAFKSAALHGIMVGSRVMFEAMLEGMAANAIRPVIDRVFPFDQAADAYRLAASGGFVGKLVVAI